MIFLPTNIAKLRKREESAFIRRKKAWIAYADMCRCTCEAHDKMKEAWEAGLSAKEAMNEAFDALIGQLGRKPRPSEYNPEYLTSRKEFLAEKTVYDAAKTEYRFYRMQRNHRNAIYDAARIEHDQAKSELIEALSDKPKLDSDTIIREVDMAQVESKPFYLKNLFGKNAIVVKRYDNSGKIDIYFDGIADDGGGIGHGHAVIDATGKVVYLRDSWRSHDDSIINDYHADNHRTSPAP